MVLCYNILIAFKFDRYLGSSAAKIPVKFESNQALSTDLRALRVGKVLVWALVDINVYGNVTTFTDFWHVWIQIPISTKKKALAYTQIAFVRWQHMSTCHNIQA